MILLFLRIFFWSIAAAGIILFFLSLTGLKSYVVLSGSMEPVIHTGSVVLVNSHQKTPEKGEVITYRLGKMNVTHRVKEIRAEGYETAGDANEISDGEYVSEKQVLGTVCFCIPYLGYALVWLRSGRGLMTCGICLLLYVCLMNYVEKKEKERYAG